MKKAIIFILYVFSGICFAQSISPSVINSGGKTSTTTLNSQTVYYTDNIGEVVIGTGSTSNNKLTQGFLQPDMITVKSTDVTPITSDVSCSDKRDGFIHMEIIDPPPGATFEYFWTPDALCPTHDCDRIDSLSKGNFTIVTVWTYTVGVNQKKDSSTHYVKIDDKNGICNIKVYTGIQISGGNSKFTIDNIELYPDAEVSIYNRWGVKLFGTTKYNNVDNYWPKKGEKVVPGTYFYIIDAGEGKVKKSWIEVFE